MIKDREYLTPTHSLKFNGTQIKLNSNKIAFTKERYVRGILLVTNHVADSTSFKEDYKEKTITQGIVLGRKGKRCLHCLFVSAKSLF